jgi:hypothetical protein
VTVKTTIRKDRANIAVELHFACRQNICARSVPERNQSEGGKQKNGAKFQAFHIWFPVLNRKEMDRTNMISLIYRIMEIGK